MFVQYFLLPGARIPSIRNIVSLDSHVLMCLSEYICISLSMS